MEIKSPDFSRELKKNLRFCDFYCFHSEIPTSPRISNFFIFYVWFPFFIAKVMLGDNWDSIDDGKVEEEGEEEAEEVSPDPHPDAVPAILTCKSFLQGNNWME